MNWIGRMLNQTAVYWGTPVDDGYGGSTLADPVLIDCYWAERQEQFVSATGKTELSRAVVMLASAVEVGGWLLLGDYDDVASSISNPNQLEEALPVRATAKIPGINPLEIVYKAWL
jgi:hypothetical protein